MLLREVRAREEEQEGKTKKYPKSCSTLNLGGRRGNLFSVLYLPSSGHSVPTRSTFFSFYRCRTRVNALGVVNSRRFFFLPSTIASLVFMRSRCAQKLLPRGPQSPPETARGTTGTQRFLEGSAIPGIRGVSPQSILRTMPRSQCPLSAHSVPTQCPLQCPLSAHCTGVGFC
jgi:hypothetical protein